jgi:thioredoxin 1
MVDSVEQLDENSISATLAQATLPVVLDFSGPSCAPCIILSKLLEELAPEFNNKLLFYKVNADAAPDTAATFGVRGLPTLILVKKNQPAATQVGILNASKLRSLLTDWSGR